MERIGRVISDGFTFQSNTTLFEEITFFNKDFMFSKTTLVSCNLNIKRQPFHKGSKPL